MAHFRANSCEEIRTFVEKLKHQKETWGYLVSAHCGLKVYLYIYVDWYIHYWYKMKLVLQHMKEETL